MPKTDELRTFERLVNDHMQSEIPADAGHVRLRAVSRDFITFVDKLHSDHNKACANKAIDSDKK